MHFKLSHLAQVAFSILALSHCISASPASKRQSQVCNGASELCDRSYGNVTSVGAHDSYAVDPTGQNLAANEDQNVTQQLTNGVRMLQVQAHNSSGTIELCHTSCLLLDGGSLQSYLTNVKSWMDTNPNEVVTMLIVNSDNFAPTDYAEVYTSAGLASMSYSPPSASIPFQQWPTLQAMISAGTRLVTFMDTGADFNSVPYIIDEFSNMWETAFDVTDPTFDCNVNRTHGDASTQLYTINHFLDSTNGPLGSLVPDKAALNTTNAPSGPGSVGLQAQQCGAEYGRNPNFLLVDFYEAANGGALQVAASLNGVTYSPTSPLPPLQTTSPTNTPGSSTSSSSAGRLRVSVAALVPALLFGACIVFL